VRADRIVDPPVGECGSETCVARHDNVDASVGGAAGTSAEDAGTFEWCDTGRRGPGPSAQQTPGGDPAGRAGTTEPLLDIGAVALWLATSSRHVRRLVTEHRIPYIKVGHFIRFDRHDIDTWIVEQIVAVDPEPVDDQPAWVKHRPGTMGRKQSLAPRASGRQAPSFPSATPPWVSPRSG
jgi:excisionase family DNA binding protein